ALRSEHARLSQIYKPKYPKLQQISKQIGDIRATLEREVNNIKTSLQVRYEQLLDREKLLEQAVNQQKNQLLELQDRAIQYNILKREWETNKELYSGLLERMKEVGVASGMELDNVAVIDRAVIPAAPFKPSLPRNMMIALVLGLMGGVGLAFLLAFLDNTVRTSEEVERLLHLPSLGLVPKVDTKALPANVSLDLLAHQMREKDLVEAMRSIRTSLMFSNVGGLPKTLAITSSAPAEGKTTTAVNLSIVLAQSGASVLLVDADLRAPRLHKVFRCPRGPGLSDYLVKGELHLAENTGVEHLTLLTSGTAPPNPAELLSSSTMDHLLEELADKYDYVLIDSSPVMGLADPIVLSTKVKGVLMVIAAGKVSKGALREAVKRLRGVNAPL
ncbi:MAG: polysaccharide biosynthesis tyrosine autokinase, partial [Candidatus Competibacteraceae bacterium]|nr:polysaccharide biosynthesis tyrosine autokinase [Candidatus Competibacteraceae bacterium]